MGSKQDRSGGGRTDEAQSQLKRSDVLVALMEAPCGAFNPWEQGFIAALTFTEAAVDAKLEELSTRNFAREWLEGLSLRAFSE